MIRTSLQEEQLGDAETVRAYKSLARVERAFRSLKSLLAVRPVFHWKQRRVRAHLLICMLAYYLEWHMRERLAPLLFLDEDRQEGKTGQAQGPHARDAGGEPAAAELPGPAGTPDDALGAGVAAGGGSGAPCVEAERADAVAGAGVRTAGEQAAPGTAPGADSGRTCGT